MPLDVDVPTECADARGGAQQEQVTVLVQVGCMTGQILELLERMNRLDGQLDIGLVRELVPDAAGISTRRSGSELRLALDEYDAPQAPAREMKRDTRAHAAASDDDGVSR
jgi:hypothetical protein